MGPRPVTGVIDLVVVQAHGRRPSVLGSTSSRRRGDPPFSAGALGGWLIPELVVESLDGVVQRWADGLGVSAQEVPHRSWRDIELCGQADGGVTDRGEGSQPPPRADSSPAEDSLLDCGGRDGQQSPGLVGMNVPLSMAAL
ncbi:MAG: hypothetical protein ACRDRJ_15080 [Streptosporangiaceae bacterium]